MLDGMRKASQGVVGKAVMTVVMGLIIVSFAVWGVGDMLRGFTSDDRRQGRARLKISHAAPTPGRQAEGVVPSGWSANCASGADAAAGPRSLGLDAQALDTHDRRGRARRARARSLGLDDVAGLASPTRCAPIPTLKGINGELRPQPLRRSSCVSPEPERARLLRAISATCILRQQTPVFVGRRPRRAEAAGRGAAGGAGRDARDRLFYVLRSQRRRRHSAALRRRAEEPFSTKPQGRPGERPSAAVSMRSS